MMVMMERRRRGRMGVRAAAVVVFVVGVANIREEGGDDNDNYRLPL